MKRKRAVAATSQPSHFDIPAGPFQPSNGMKDNGNSYLSSFPAAVSPHLGKGFAMKMPMAVPQRQQRRLAKQARHPLCSANRF
ncbi:hypothetical protein OCK02_15770 [Rhizobium sp. TRM96647]|uniref:hypothetical protein n=1 Tax=unclassified Rhizobium TaxID=2613769 RepID=UPI0021E8AA8E|nr:MULTISPECIES: hypothetical protein [unclassified Rhizobium]MCV3737668.1 hypothetical protein [Rhizobium sp. TRM96647]MCV3759601.1 hypothetical protein [Rhizobium sp. TRM96650]